MKTCKKNIYILLIILIGIPVLQSCSEKKQTKRQLVVTIEPLRYFTQSVAGNKFDVMSMVPQGNNPESYDPTPQQLIKLENCEAYFRIGYIGFEQTWMGRLQQNSPKMKIFDTSKGIKLIASPHIHNETNEHSIATPDPHIWNSTANARIIVKNIYNGLCELNPENKEYFKQNMDRLLKEIDRIDKKLNVLISRTKNHTFLIFHPALSYFAKDYGLEQICIEEEGKEPSPIYLKDLIQTCKKKKIKTIFIQEEFDKRNAELISRETGTRLVIINPLSYKWGAEMLYIAKSLNNE